MTNVRIRIVLPAPAPSGHDGPTHTHVHAASAKSQRSENEVRRSPDGCFERAVFLRRDRMHALLLSISMPRSFRSTIERGMSIDKKSDGPGLNRIPAKPMLRKFVEIGVQLTRFCYLTWYEVECLIRLGLITFVCRQRLETCHLYSLLLRSIRLCLALLSLARLKGHTMAGLRVHPASNSTDQTPHN